MYQRGTSQQTFVLMKTSCRRLSSSSSEDSSWSYILKTSSRRFQDVLKTSSRCLQDIFKTSSKRLQDIFNTSSKCLEDVFKTFSRRIIKLNCFANTFSRCLRDIFKTFLRRTSRTLIYRGICLGHTSENFMVSVQILQEWQKFVKY